MRTLFSFLAIVCSVLFMQSQQKFEGKIAYKNTCRSTNPDWKTEYCQMIADSAQAYYFKDGDYKYVSLSSGKWTFYKKSNNKIYNKGAEIYWTDAAANEEEILEIQVNKNKLVVMGYTCDELIVKTKSNIQKYYFNPVTAVDPKDFENHKQGNLNKIMAITKAIPLKTIFIIAAQNFELESIATEIRKGKLTDKLFELPKESEIIEGKHQ